MAASYVAALRMRQPQGPYRLGGYSLGGTIALEMALQLQAAGEQVSLLALLDTAPPERSTRRQWTRAELLFGVWGAALGFAQSDLEALDDEAQIDFVLERATAQGHVPEGYARAEALRQVRVIETATQAVAEYAPAARFVGEAVLFQAQASAKDSAVARWRRAIDGELRVIGVPGDHMSLMLRPQVDALAARLDEVLAVPPPRRDRDDVAAMAELSE
jgi:thioesterase domain-containing protein